MVCGESGFSHFQISNGISITNEFIDGSPSRRWARPKPRDFSGVRIAVFRRDLPTKNTLEVVTDSGHALGEALRDVPHQAALWRGMFSICSLTADQTAPHSTRGEY